MTVSFAGRFELVVRYGVVAIQRCNAPGLNPISLLSVEEESSLLGRGSETRDGPRRKKEEQPKNVDVDE